MRKFLIFVVALVLIVVGLGVFLVTTTPRQGAGVRTPLGEHERGLIAQVPASAESFAIIPTAAAFDAKLRANPVTRATIESWKAQQPLPRSWMIGDADLVAWKSGKQTRYFLRLDPFRATLVRMYLMAGGNTGGTLLINAPAEQPIDSAAVARIVDQASKLPAGDALVVQLGSARGAYPPLSRPAVTSVQVTGSDVLLTSVAHPEPRSGEGSAAQHPHFPQSALFSAAFSSPPRVVGDLNRLFGAKVSTLLEDGGAICIYDVDLRKLLPRPLGVIVLPADPTRRAIVDSFRQAEAVGIHVRTAEIGNELVVAFDDSSIGKYQKDVFEAPAMAGDQWTVRTDPARLVPILNGLGENLGLRIAAPRLFRSARDLHQWISGLEQAKVIEASDSADSQVETLRVRIGAK